MKPASQGPRDPNKGCATGFFVGCGVLAALFIIVPLLIWIGARVINDYNRDSSTPTHLASRAVRPLPGRGWFTNYHLDLWDSLADWCAGTAQGVADAMAQGGATPFDASSDVASMAGHHYLPKGVRVALLGHGERPCFHAQLRMTHIRVDDRRSPLNGRAGYIQLGSLVHR